MYRGILLAENDNKPSDDELDFYLNKVIDAYADLRKRRNRFIVLAITVAAASLAIALSTPNTTNPSAVKLPVLGIALAPHAAIAVMNVLAITFSYLSWFSRLTSWLYRAEIDTLHRLRYGSEPPFWFFATPSPIELAHIFPSIGLAGRACLFLVVGLAMSPLIGTVALVVHSWSDLPLFSQVVHGVGLGAFVLLGPLFFYVEKRYKTLLDEARTRWGAMPANKTLNRSGG